MVPGFEDAHDPAFVTGSITRRVPMLINDGFALSESSAISEYLDEAFPGSRLYPVAPRSRARARQLLLNRLILHGDAVSPPLVEYANRQWFRPAVQ